MTEPSDDQARLPNAEPEPVDPEPVDPEPVDPEPVDPERADCEAVDAEPADGEAVDAEPADGEAVGASTEAVPLAEVGAAAFSDTAFSDTALSAEPTEAALPLGDDERGPGLEQARPRSVSDAHLKAILEALIFVSDKPVSVRQLTRISKAGAEPVKRLLRALQQEYAGRGIELVEAALGFQFRSAPAHAPFVREMVAKKPVRLSRAQTEALAIVAYRQPITRPELDEIRGVDSAAALKPLLERGLVKILGRKEEPGRPLLYGTTPHFLDLFGLANLSELPTLKEFSELSDDSKALFARKTGESLDSLAMDAAAPPPHRDETSPAETETVDAEVDGGLGEAVSAWRDAEPGAPAACPEQAEGG